MTGANTDIIFHKHFCERRRRNIAFISYHFLCYVCVHFYIKFLLYVYLLLFFFSLFVSFFSVTHLSSRHQTESFTSDGGVGVTVVFRIIIICAAIECNFCFVFLLDLRFFLLQYLKRPCVHLLIDTIATETSWCWMSYDFFRVHERKLNDVACALVCTCVCVCALVKQRLSTLTRSSKQIIFIIIYFVWYQNFLVSNIHSIAIVFELAAAEKNLTRFRFIIFKALHLTSLRSAVRRKNYENRKIEMNQKWSLASHRFTHSLCVDSSFFLRFVSSFDFCAKFLNVRVSVCVCFRFNWSAKLVRFKWRKRAKLWLNKSFWKIRERDRARGRA